jgi:predicted metalloprotease
MRIALHQEVVGTRSNAMRWESGRRSSNIEDRRGLGGAGMKVGGLGAVIVLIVALFTGVDPAQLMGMLEGGSASVQSGGRTGAQPKDPQADFVSVVLADTEDTWGRILSSQGGRYEPPRLVLFDNATPSACGMGQAAMGPFYCPSDRSVYIDLRFFRELDRRFGAPGDFAQAYVVAHEVGHHVQNVLGIAGQVRTAQSRRKGDANALQVRMELQADCFAGVWAHHAQSQRQVLEPGDIEEGLRAAAAIGDDTLQRRTQGHVTPETWTHGSSAQRARWFNRGFESGRMQDCDTFSAAAL